MDTVDKAYKMATKACKLANDAKDLITDKDKYIVIGAIDTLWQNPDKDTVIFYSVVEDTSQSPIHMEELSYNDIIHNYEGVGKCLFTESEALKLAKRYEKMPSNLSKIMSVSTFKDKYGNMFKDC